MADYNEKQKLLCRILIKIDEAQEEIEELLGEHVSGEDFYNASQTMHYHLDIIRNFIKKEEPQFFDPTGYLWKHRMPLIELYDFSEKEMFNLLDLYEQMDKKIVQRVYDDKWKTLNKKDAVMVMYENDRYNISMTKRGIELVETYIKEGN